MKKLLHIAILSLIVLCFSGCYWGWGWLVPYSFQPSYHKFKKMCKVNELPNNEEKYNKILSYFDTDLDHLESDWGKLIDEEWEIPNNDFYKKGIFEYAAATNRKKRRWINSRINAISLFVSHESKINRYNINAMSVIFYWHSKRLYLDGNEGSGFYWSEIEVDCSDIGIVSNYEPKGANNEE